MKDDPCQPWLRSTLRLLFYGSTTPFPRIAEISGCSMERLHAYASENQAIHKHLPAWRIVPLSVATQSFALLDALESQVGRQGIIQAPSISGATIARHAIQAVRAICTMCEQGTEAVASGNMSREDAMLFKPEIAKLRECLNRFDLEIDLRDATEGG